MGIRKLQQLQQTTLTGILVQNWRNTRSAVVPNSWRWVSFPNHSMLSVPQLFNDKQQMVPTRYEWSFKFLYCDALRIIHCLPHLNMEKPNEPRESFEPSSGNRQMSKSMRQSVRKKNGYKKCYKILVCFHGECFLWVVSTRKRWMENYSGGISELCLLTYGDRYVDVEFIWWNIWFCHSLS